MTHSVLRTLLFCGTATAPLALAVGVAQARMQCDGLDAGALGLEGVSIISAKETPAGDGNPAAACIVSGTAGAHKGIDGHDYAIGFEIRLPDEWNGRFFHQLNGGNDGAVVPATGPLLGGNKQRTALAEGYAVISSDAGHDGKAQPDAGLAGSNRFGLDPQARSDYGYAAGLEMTRVGKKIVAAYYGEGPKFSYAVGCSNGGRHAMVTAAREPGEYDGILAGDPGFDLPRAAIQHALDVQTFKSLGGDIRKSFSTDELNLVADGIRAACDRLDGAEDGMVLDWKACQSAFDIDALQCKAGQNSQCLPAEKVAALKTIHAGPRNSKGEQLYSDWPWDPGIGAGNWRFWKIESPIPPWEHMPLIAVMGAGSLAHIFTTPPTTVGGSPKELEDYLLGFDFDRDAPKISATDDTFRESAMDFMSPPGSDDPKLAEFRNDGGKMILFHGTGDPVFSFNETKKWYDRLDANNGGNAGSFVQFYPVPNMTHCSGGPATDDFDLFRTLVDWVEKDKQPGPVDAAVMADNKDLPADWAKDRGRPLCPYPQVAHYDGGDMEKAESFSCAAP